MRVVLDTNILISACWKPGGNEALLVERAITGELSVCVSVALEAEYREVAARKKFAKQRECLEATIAGLMRVAAVVEAPSVCDSCLDRDDNLLLDCALAGGADFVVTGNLRHFPGEWRGVRVVNVRGLLELGH